MSPPEAATPSLSETPSSPLSGNRFGRWGIRGQSTPGMVAALALLGAVNPTPMALAGIHQFYLGRPRWGVLYLLLGWTPIPRFACALEGIGYLVLALQQQGQWPWSRGMTESAIAAQTHAIAAAIRDLERLRQEGLVTDQEFEQQRRQLLGDET